MSLAVIKYNAGNIQSVSFALKHDRRLSLSKPRIQNRNPSVAELVEAICSLLMPKTTLHSIDVHFQISNFKFRLSFSDCRSRGGVNESSITA